MIQASIFSINIPLTLSKISINNKAIYHQSLNLAQQLNKQNKRYLTFGRQVAQMKT